MEARQYMPVQEHQIRIHQVSLEQLAHTGFMEEKAPPSRRYDERRPLISRLTASRAARSG
jgi:hypothetical protein